MKVWIATKGCYSDYSIIGVFSTKESAQVVSSQYDGYGGGNDPECYVIDELEGGYKKTKFYCHLDRRTGNSIKQGVIDGYEVVPKNARVPETSSYVFGPSSEHNEFICAESYVSPEHALKLAIEYRQKLLRKKLKERK